MEDKKLKAQQESGSEPKLESKSESTSKSKNESSPKPVREFTPESTPESASEPEREKKSFKYWFENVFWFHYRWLFLGVVFVIALIVFISIESSGNENYDMTLVFAQEGEIAESQAKKVMDAVSESIGDLDGDGAVRLNFASIDLGAVANTNGRTVSLGERLMLYMVDEDNTLFFINGDTSESYCAMGYFDDELSNYGIETEEGDPYRVYISDTEVFADAGLQDLGYYALIIDWTTVGRGEQKRTDAAVAAVKTLLG